MALIVVGGHSRSVGKTSVVAGLIAALPEFRWTAMKITQYGHGICSRNGKVCHCATDDHSWAIDEERNISGKSDSSRCLLSGAVRSLWRLMRQGMLADAMHRVREEMALTDNMILESNSILQFVIPDLYVTRWTLRPKISNCPPREPRSCGCGCTARRIGSGRLEKRSHSSRWRINRPFTFTHRNMSPRN